MPINKRTRERTCITSYTDCIKYDGPDIPCIGLYNGDYINQIIAVIADKICKLSQPLDISSLTIQCLLDNFNGLKEPINKSITSYFQLLIDNDCNIKELIDLISERIDGISNTNLVLDLKCLAIPDAFGNTTYSTQSVLQTLINETCSHKLNLISLNGTVVSLQSQINAITPYTEPTLTSCVYTAQPTSQALQLLASNYCTYKVKVGDAGEIDTAISRQCAGLNTLFVANANFIQAPTSLADSDNNQWITICNLLGRVTALEACACKVKCEDVKIGFEVELNDDGDAITLHYTSVMGTFIPTGFTDTGSTLTITDEFGHERKYYNLLVSQNGTSPSLDITPFNTTKPLTLCLEVTLASAGLTCVKCECRTYYLNDPSCPVCKVCVGSGTGEVVLVYETTSITPNPAPII